MTAGKRILVAYYSLSGNTERVAEDLATRLGADLEKITEGENRRGFFGHMRAALDSILEKPADLRPIEKHPRDYALTLIGTPIWAGKITPAVRAYLRTIHCQCNDVAFFTTSGSTPAEKVVPAMERLAGRQAIAFAGFNYNDLKTESAYRQKLATFLGALRRERACEVCGQEPTHAHA
jgi:flavodoxin